MKIIVVPVSSLFKVNRLKILEWHLAHSKNSINILKKNIRGIGLSTVGDTAQSTYGGIKNAHQ